MHLRRRFVEIKVEHDGGPPSFRGGSGLGELLPGEPGAASLATVAGAVATERLPGLERRPAPVAHVPVDPPVGRELAGRCRTGRLHATPAAFRVAAHVAVDGLLGAEGAL